MRPEWNVVEISHGFDQDEASEPMGKKDKFWVELDSGGPLWLLKMARDTGGTIRGEDWAEWAVHHLATLLDLPSAVVRPATWEGRRAIVSKSVNSRSEQLVHGNSVLFGHDPVYDKAAERETPGYTPQAVKSALAGVTAPTRALDLCGLDGFDVWAGYLMLDAWVAGRDRHHENWAIIRNGSERRLAPSFDHGNSLGFAESDASRERTLASDSRFAKWISRGTSHHFAGRPALVDVALDALELASDEARRTWPKKLETLDDARVQDVLTAIPLDILSEVGRTFVLRLLDENKRRLLDGYRAARSR